MYKKLKEAASQQLMCELPFARRTLARPFLNTWVDNGGSILDKI
jgi:hypothetical protein